MKWALALRVHVSEQQRETDPDSPSQNKPTAGYNPPSAARGGLKENGQNPDSGSKNSENQNNDAVL